MALKYPIDILGLAKCKVLNESGHEVQLSSLWRNQTAIFIFLRHFACITCRGHAKQIWNQKDTYQKQGGKLYFIGNGTPNFIAKFKEDLNIQDAPVFTDPTLQSFRSAGFKRGFIAALRPASLINGVKLSSAGFKQGKYEKAAGDLWQLGGILVIHQDGRVPYQYISEAAGDYPPEKDLHEEPATSSAS